MILLNRIQTPDGTLLTSYHKHDYKSYLDTISKEEYVVDGGSEYLRRSVNTIPYVELSINDDGNHETRRNNLHWGRNYDKDNNLLPETEWILIKNITNDHLEALLTYLKNRKSTQFFIDLFNNEYEYRKLNKSA